jgi:hypothetical protein
LFSDNAPANTRQESQRRACDMEANACQEDSESTGDGDSDHDLENENDEGDESEIEVEVSSEEEEDEYDGGEEEMQLDNEQEEDDEADGQLTDDEDDDHQEGVDEEMQVPTAWSDFAAAAAVWPPNTEEDNLSNAMGCLLNLLRMHSMKSLSGKTLEANVLMWKSLGVPWADSMPVKAQSIRK